MFEYIAELSNTHIVDRRGRYFLVQPTPVRAYLGARRIDLLRTTTITRFIEEAAPELQHGFFRQWRYFDNTKNAPTIAERLLSRTGPFGTFEALETEAGASVLNDLVHVVPDGAADTLYRNLGSLNLEQLQALSQGRRHIVWALQKLVFRQESFARSARLLMRLAAAENEDVDNNAAGQFKQLYQVRLSGTEATPAERFAILDEGLASPDDRIAAVCFEALQNTLKTTYFSRSGNAEQIGSGPPRRDWHPRVWADVYDFHRQGLRRLDDLRSRGGPFVDRCEKAIATHLRGLLHLDLLPDITSLVQKIARERGLWLDAIHAIGDWLFFDRRGVPEPFPSQIRALYDMLMPTDLVERALLYTKFWSAEIRDPDAVYDDRATERDYEYSTRKACELASLIAANPAALERTISEMVAQDLHNVFPFARELGANVPDPRSTFSAAISTYEQASGTKSTQFIRGLLSGIDSRDTQTGSACLQMALASEALREHTIGLYGALHMSPARLQEITSALHNGGLHPATCVSLSYGRGLDHLTAAQVQPFLEELSTHGADGLWAALEIISMYQLNRPTLDIELQTTTKRLLTSTELLQGGARRNSEVAPVVRTVFPLR